MTPAEETVKTVYEAIQRGDAAAATACYCDDAYYEDLAFKLKGNGDIDAHVALVCSRKVKVAYTNIHTDGLEVKGHWVFDYVFAKTGRPVHNEMNSTFKFRDGKIVDHRDEGNRWEWSKQALGFPQDIIVTLAPPILRRQAIEELEKFKAEEKLVR